MNGRRDDNKLSRFADGCHKFGPLVNAIILILGFGVLWGEMHFEVADLHDRVVRIEDFLLGGKK